MDKEIIKGSELMKFTPQNLIELPAGKYSITRKPYITNPDFVEENELHITDDNGERIYYIGKFPDRFRFFVEEDAEGDLFIHACVTVANNSFTLSANGERLLKKYFITLGTQTKNS